jgi:RNA polymerase sigma-70 factor (ECF subfamily)
MQRVADGDRAAFRAVVSAHEAAVRRVASARVSHGALVDEVVQEAFLAAWRGAGSFRGDSSLRGWLCGLTRHQAARTWRRRAGEPVAAASVDDTPLLALGLAAGWGDDPERAVAGQLTARCVRRALTRLSEADREVITLRDLEGLSGPEAADEVGVPLAALKTRLHRARLRLMAALREEGCDDAA